MTQSHPGTSEAHSISVPGAIQERTRKTTRKPITSSTSCMAQQHHSTQPNGTLCLCLDPSRLNQVLTKAMHRDPTFNDILPKLTCVFYDHN